MKERKGYQSPQVKVMPVRNTQLLCASVTGTEQVSKTSSFYYDFDNPEGN